jgi:hypothetical protein
MAVVAVAAMTAVLAAGSASATVLCKTAFSPCTGGTYPSSTTIAGTERIAGFAIVTNLGTIKCFNSELSGKTTSAGGAGVSVQGTVQAFRFVTCELGPQSCTLSAVHLPYSAEISWTAGSNGNLKLKSSGAGNPGITAKCGILINCEFTTASAELGLTGGSPATAENAFLPLSQSGGICPSTSFGRFAYNLFSPSPLFIASS